MTDEDWADWHAYAKQFEDRLAHLRRLWPEARYRWHLGCGFWQDQVGYVEIKVTENSEWGYDKILTDIHDKQMAADPRPALKIEDFEESVVKFNEMLKTFSKCAETEETWTPEVKQAWEDFKARKKS